jgi:hypothetical protein
VAGGTRLPLTFFLDLLLLEAALAACAFVWAGLPEARRRLPRPTLPHQLVEAGVFLAILAGEVRARVARR